ncbi:MAG: hypothetical protein KBB95_25495 [Deltaproteobacteria bacterium]|nr:hypothetical protein [Deltaproteobacteria bacterium]
MKPRDRTLADFRAEADWAETHEPVADITMGLELSYRANARGHTRYQSRATKQARENGQWLARMTKARHHASSFFDVLLVRWTRIYSGRERPYDDDNAGMALKSIRDGFCDVLKVNDGDVSKVVFLQVEQVSGPKTGLRVRLYRKALT